MASSSLSQESLDHELNLMARKNRVKIAARNRAMYTKHGSIETTDDHDIGDKKMEELMAGEHVLCVSPGTLLFDHESPNRMTKMKEKRWPSHKNKPMIKDKRKLREKRRSSGVVHVQSTESSDYSNVESSPNSTSNSNNAATTSISHPSSSTSYQPSSFVISPTTTNQPTSSQSITTPFQITTPYQAPLTSATTSTKTHHNEVIDADNPQTPEEDRKPFNNRVVRNKSPSDLDADLEDNQDYDSTVSHSDNISSQQLTSSSSRQPNQGVGGIGVVCGGGSTRGGVGMRGYGRGSTEGGMEVKVVAKRVAFESQSHPSTSTSISSPPLPKAFISHASALRQQQHHHHHHHHHHGYNKYNNKNNNNAADDSSDMPMQQRQQSSAEELLRIEQCRVKELEMLVHQKDDVIKKLQLQLLSLNNVKLHGSLAGV